MRRAALTVTPVVQTACPKRRDYIRTYRECVCARLTRTLRDRQYVWTIAFPATVWTRHVEQHHCPEAAVFVAV